MSVLGARNLLFYRMGEIKLQGYNRSTWRKGTILSNENLALTCLGLNLSILSCNTSASNGLINGMKSLLLRKPYPASLLTYSIHYSSHLCSQHKQSKVSKSQLGLFSDRNRVILTPLHRALRTYPE